MRVLILLLLPALSNAAESRLSEARGRRMPEVRALLEDAGIPFPPPELYLRAFKQERELEVWSAPRCWPPR